LPSESDLAVVGPMTRTAADLVLVLDVIAGPDEERRHRLPTGFALRPA
jgi:amidase